MTTCAQGTLESEDLAETKLYVGPDGTLAVTPPAPQRAACLDANGGLPLGCPGWCEHANPVHRCLARPREQTDPFGEGTRLQGGLRLLQRIGAGAMGTVFAADDTCLGRQVAVKVLRGQHDDWMARRRFVLEARAMARVRHPNVVRILSWGHERGWPYFSMEYIDGTDLRRILHAVPGRRLPVARALDVVHAVSSGLQAIHDAGALHNDIKLSNIIVGTDARVVLGDFGLARPLSPACRLDRSELAGTPAYMAPEVAAATLDRPRRSVDIYSLGIVAFRLLTGHMPFAHRDPRTLMRMHVRMPPPRPTFVAPDLPPAVDAVLLAALSKDPSRRPESARQFSHDLLAAVGPQASAKWPPARLAG